MDYPQCYVSDGYTSNLQNFLNSQKSWLLGMRSHFCHVFLKGLLPLNMHEDIVGKIRITNSYCLINFVYAKILKNYLQG